MGKRILSIMLCICMLLANASGVGAVAGAPNVTMAVNGTSVDVGDTITVTLSCSEHVVAGFGLYLEFDKELLECTEIIGPDGDDYYYILYINEKGREKEADPQVYDDVANTNSDGIYSLGWVSGSDTTICEQDLIVLTFIAKAAGTVNFVLNEQSSGSDEFKGVAETKTVTIGGTSAPSCDHIGTTYTYETNNNGTHKVKCECGEYKTESEACSDDATDNNHACDFCGYSVGLEDCSDKAGDDDHNCDVCNAENVSDHSYGTATCDAAATCTECSAPTGTALGHIDENKDHKCDRNCGKTDMGEHADSATDDDHVCDYGCKAVLEACSDKAGDGNHNCDVCNAEDVSDHSYGTATCDAAATCTECDAPTGTALGHIDENKDHKCDRNCGKTDMNMDKHVDSATDDDHVCDYGCKAVLEACSGGEATCTELAKCEICGKEYGELNKDNHKNTDIIGTVFHPVGDGTHYSWNGCSACGEKKVKKVIGDCSDSNDDKDHNCDYCGTTNIEGHTNGAPVQENIEEAKCEDAGSYDEVVYCTECGAEVSRTNKEIPALNHQWNEATYTWSEDGKSCTAERICKNDASHKETETVTATGKVTTPATCTEKGTTTYTANFEAEWAVDGQTKEVQDVSATEHSWTVSYVWAQENGAWYCTATRICGNDAKHNLTEKVAATGKVTTSATCTEKGTTTYTANFEAEWAVDGQTKEVQDVPANNHSFANARGSLKTAGTCTAEAVYAVKCDNCSAESDELTVKGEKDASNHTGKPVYTINGETHSATYNCCGAAYVTNEEHTYDESGNECICGAKKPETHVCAHYEYKDITATTHQSYCSCGEKIGTAEAHTFNLEGNNKCICGRGVEITLTFWKNSTNKHAIVSGEYGTKLTAPPVNPTFGNAKFVGWKDANGVTVDENYTFTANVDVFAQWKTGWVEIEGEWYYVDPTTGNYAKGLQRLPYQTEAKYEGYDEDLAYAVEHGKEFIDKDLAWYIFDETGKLMTNLTGIKDGKYFLNGMMVWHPGFVEVDGEWYYFIGDTENGGNKMAEGQIYVTRNAKAAGYETGDQLVFVNGKVDTSVDGIITKENVLYYYEDGKLMAGAGLVKVEEGKYIYVRSYGQLALGNYWVTTEKANGLLEGGKLYDFGTDGYLTIDPNKNGIIDGVYYKEGVPYYAGLIKIGEDYYYVRSDGQIATGKYYITKTNDVEGFYKGMKLFFGEDGKLQPVKNGVVEENDELYYYEDNHLMYGAGLLKLEDGSYIYVRSNGQLAVGKYYITTVNEELQALGYKKGMKLFFGNDGKYFPEN